MTKHSSAREILQRIKDLYDISTDAELAEFFGITPSALSNWKYRNTVDYRLLFEKCYGFNYHYIITGEGEKYAPDEDEILEIQRGNKDLRSLVVDDASVAQKKVLIIEDHTQMRQLIERHLKKEGYAVLGAGDGTQGLALAKEHIPDIIISDIVMPGLSGYEVLREIRADLQTTHIPLLFISSKADLAEIRHAMNLGADDYLTKPIQIKELLQAVHARLHKSALVQRQMDSVLQKIRSGFVRVLPHEFRTPLSTIIGGTKYIIDSFENLSKPEILELLKMVNSSTNHLNRLLEKILLYAKLEAIAHEGEEGLEQLGRRVTENAGDVISDIVLDVAQEHHRIKDIDLSIAEDSIALAINPVYLTTLVTEIVENAIKFSQAGSPIAVSLTRENSHAVLTVRDEGRGMSASQIKNIGAFTQFDREMYEQQGVGLGFSIIARIVDLFKGKLQIKSEPARGTQVSVTLEVVHLAPKPKK
ncbi:MAG: response regulator [Bacteroidota bacterium]|nr:response regulator [Candidatus Kapabacteria bacterium]MDW8219233.1 response regulator [Bacteroidota bacterium]